MGAYVMCGSRSQSRGIVAGVNEINGAGLSFVRDHLGKKLPAHTDVALVSRICLSVCLFVCVCLSLSVVEAWAYQGCWTGQEPSVGYRWLSSRQI